MRRSISDERSDLEQQTVVVRAGMDAWERQQVFREMVAQQLRNGPLSRIRRRRIVQFAAQLGITAVLAGRLVQQAQRAHERDDPRPSVESPTPTVEGQESRVFARRPRAVVAIVIGLVLINSWMVLRLLG